MCCPNCKGNTVIKYGKQCGKQMYYCKQCKKKFSKAVMKHKSYSPFLITSAISYYNLGNTLEQSVKLVNRQFKVKVSKSALHYWVKQSLDICTYHKIRSDIRKNYKKNIICEYGFEHSGLTYNFMYHLPKVDFLCQKYPSVGVYLKEMKSRCPSEIFQNSHRCSQIKNNIKIKTQGISNSACKLAEFALTACTKNNKRHTTVEKFMLINDSSTIACEVPIWFWDTTKNIGLCGHIDILQIRRGRIYILDYKPNAHKESVTNVASQLYNYAIGLCFRTKVPLSMIRCAWFDKNIYYEFNPVESQLIHNKKDRKITTKVYGE